MGTFFDHHPVLFVASLLIIGSAFVSYCVGSNMWSLKNTKKRKKQ